MRRYDGEISAHTANEMIHFDPMDPRKNDRLEGWLDHFERHPVRKGSPLAVLRSYLNERKEPPCFERRERPPRPAPRVACTEEEAAVYAQEGVPHEVIRMPDSPDVIRTRQMLKEFREAPRPDPEAEERLQLAAAIEDARKGNTMVLEWLRARGKVPGWVDEQLRGGGGDGAPHAV